MTGSEDGEKEFAEILSDLRNVDERTEKVLALHPYEVKPEDMYILMRQMYIEIRAFARFVLGMEDIMLKVKDVVEELGTPEGQQRLMEQAMKKLMGGGLF